VNCDRADP